MSRPYDSNREFNYLSLHTVVSPTKNKIQTFSWVQTAGIKLVNPLSKN